MPFVLWFPLYPLNIERSATVSVMGLDKVGWWFVVPLVGWSSARAGVISTLPAKWAPRKSVDLGLYFHLGSRALPCAWLATTERFLYGFTLLYCIHLSFVIYFVLIIFLSFRRAALQWRHTITQDDVPSYGRDTSTLFHFISFQL